VTISLVIPTVLDLHSQLKAKGDRVRQCGLLVTALLKSLVQRFPGNLSELPDRQHKRTQLFATAFQQQSISDCCDIGPTVFTTMS